MPRKSAISPSFQGKNRQEICYSRTTHVPNCTVPYTMASSAKRRGSPGAIIAGVGLVVGIRRRGDRGEEVVTLFVALGDLDGAIGAQHDERIGPAVWRGAVDAEGLLPGLGSGSSAMRFSSTLAPVPSPFWHRKHLRVGSQRKKGVSAGRSMSKMRMESLTRLTSRLVQSQRSSYTLSLSKPTIFKPSIEFTPTATYRVSMVW